METTDKSIECPKCKVKGCMTLTDYQPLDTYHDIDNVKLSNFFFDSEMYAMAKCWHCGHEFNVVGQITWEQPKAVNRDYAENGDTALLTDEAKVLQFNEMLIAARKLQMDVETTQFFLSMINGEEEALRELIGKFGKDTVNQILSDIE